VAASIQVPAAASRSSPESAPCSCRLLSHQTLLWHHRLGHPSLPRLRGMASRVLVSGLPWSLPPRPPGPAPTCVPCVEGRQRAAPHSSEFPPTEAPLQTLHMDVWGPARVRGQGHERYFLLVVDDYSRYTIVFPLRSKGETEAESFPLPVWEPSVMHRASARPSRFRPLRSKMGLLSAALAWSWTSLYAAHQLNLQPRVSLPETSHTLLWTGKVGDASAFRFYHPTSHRVLSSQDVTFDESVPYYRLFPYRTASLPPPPLFLAPGPPPVDPLPPQGPAPSGVSQVDAVEPVEVAVDSGAATGAEPAGAGSGGAGSGGAETEGAEPGGAGAGEGPRCIARFYDSPIRSSPAHASYPLSILARYVAPGRHRAEHMAAAKRVLRYLCSTSGMGLVLGGQRPVVLTGHADASWADDQATQRSSQGYTFSLGSGSVSWRSTRSPSVLSSSCEAEIYAGAMAAQELRGLTYLLTDLGEQPRSPPVLYVDNKAMLALCREHRLEHRMKHIALRYFLARELQQRGQLRLAYVASEANTADIFTKALAPGDHQRFCTLLACFALLDWSCDLSISPTLPMGVFLLVPNTFASSVVDVVLTGHSDASWVTQRSSHGYTFSLGSSSVSWRSTRLSSVLSSSCEAEIYATAMAAQELRWLTYLLTDLGKRPRSPLVLYQRGQLRLTYVATRANTADIFTKALPPGDHQRFCTLLGLVPTLPHLL
ncbi:unnamed protein product, partial [Closterium sp. NIES-53]